MIVSRPDELEGEIQRLLAIWRVSPPKDHGTRPPGPWTDAKAAEEARLWLEASEAGCDRGESGFDREGGRIVSAAIWAAWCRWRDGDRGDPDWRHRLPEDDGGSS